MEFINRTDIDELASLDSDFTIRPYHPSDGLIMLSMMPPEYSDSPDVVFWCTEADEEGKSFTICKKEVEIIACVGIKDVIKGVGLAWALYPSNIGDYHIDPRIIKYRLREMMVEHNYRRVQATVRADFIAGIKYIEWLGFVREGIMAKYEPDGTDSILYAITR